MRAMVATLTLTGVLAAGFAVASVATAQDAEPSEAADAPVAAGDEGLVDRLIEIERQLPMLPPTDARTSPDATFGELDGDFVGAAASLELIEDAAMQLFIDADSATGPVADAVASVARSYVRMRESFDMIGRFDDPADTRPLGTSDADGVATGRDVVVGYLEAGIPLLDQARADALAGYALLRDSDAADDAEKGLFDAAFRDAERYVFTLRPAIARLVSLPASVMLPISRFEGDGTEASAKTVEYVCVPRDMYPVEAPDPVQALTILVAAGANLPSVSDCPDTAAGRTP